MTAPRSTHRKAQLGRSVDLGYLDANLDTIEALT